MNKIKLTDIKISKEFQYSNPSQKKIDKALKFISRYKRIDKPIILIDGMLVDGYTRYLAAQTVGLLKIPFIELNELIYIVGQFNNNKKEYIWKNDKFLDINIGDNVLVKVKQKDRYKNVNVQIVNIFSSNDLKLYNKHKSVIKKYIKIINKVIKY